MGFDTTTTWSLQGENATVDNLFLMSCQEFQTVVQFYCRLKKFQSAGLIRRLIENRRCWILALEPFVSDDDLRNGIWKHVTDLYKKECSEPFHEPIIRDYPLRIVLNHKTNLQIFTNSDIRSHLLYMIQTKFTKEFHVIFSWE